MNHRLRNLMRDYKITQKMMAQELGIEVATFNRKINGSANFTASQFKKMAEILKITVDEII